MVNGSRVDSTGPLLAAVWSVLPEAVIAVEECPTRFQLGVHGRLARIWASILGNPIWLWKPELGTLRLIVLYDDDVPVTRYGDAADAIRDRIDMVRPAGLKIEIEYHQGYRGNG